ncbi:glycosyltransferase [Xylophilus sp. Kf1]|nr:glycosyltransferase [Xylophilus sp. Kf1]
MAKRDGRIHALNLEIHRLNGENSRLSSRLDEEAATHARHQATNRASSRQHAGLEGEIAALRRSTSWRVTSPLRWLGTQKLRVRRLARIVPAGIAMNGGLVRTAEKALGILRASGFGGLRRAMGMVETATVGVDAAGLDGGMTEGGRYGQWIEAHDTVSADRKSGLQDRIQRFALTPTISIVMPSYNCDARWLREAVDSVKRQIYPHWELCIADDASTLAESKALLTELAASDDRIKLVFREKNGHISAASNSALSLATGDWIALMDHDDLLPEHALFWVVDRINQHPDVRLLYSDEDKVDEAGTRSQPYFKPDWNIDLFRSQNVFCHLGVIRADLMRQVGGFREGFEGAQDYDLILRCIERIEPSQIQHIPRVLYHWRMHAASTAQSGDAKPYAVTAGERALNEHCQRSGIDAVAEHAGHGYRMRYALPAELPLVTLVIPTRNAHVLLRQCVDSITRLTTYASYEIVVVDNGSDEAESLAYFAELARRPGFSVIRDDGEFNYSAINNLAVRQARGSVIGLVNNDIEVIAPEWLSEMVSIALQPGVGAVGARLLYPDRRLQHGGVVLGIGGVAGHSHKYLDDWQAGYFSRARLIQSYSAVTAACLVVRKAHYLAVGGLNEKELKVAFNDVDFCLRLREAGLRNVWTPYAELFHHESATRGAEVSPAKQARFNSEVDYMLRRWGPWLSNDPAYNPNLTLIREDFSYAAAPRLHSYKAG